MRSRGSCRPTAGPAWSCPLAPAKFSWIDRGPNSGQSVVKVESQTGAIAYGRRPWSLDLDDIDQLQKATISGLTPAGTYQFQVRALGKLGYTDWSPSMKFIPA